MFTIMTFGSALDIMGEGEVLHNAAVGAIQVRQAQAVFTNAAPVPPAMQAIPVQRKVRLQKIEQAGGNQRADVGIGCHSLELKYK